ncbi:MAG: FtsQ-type POTRA domain-containing protein [Clostridiales bacterium]|nr:FtsQ-type POTRA domain-containing protein [Clostridiales bacterium]
MSDDENKKDLDESVKPRDDANVSEASEQDLEEHPYTEPSEDEGVVVVEAEEAQVREEPSGEPVKQEEKGEPAPAKRKPAPHPVVAKKKKKGNGKEYLPDFPYDFKTVLGALLAVSVVVFIWSVIFHPAMRIQTINVEGNYELTDEQIMDALDIHVGDHILKFTFLKALALAKSTPYIEDVDVRISFPASVTIDVQERHKLAYIKVPDGYIAIDEFGMILEFTTFETEDVHPILCGLDINNVVVGSYTDVTESLKFRKMILVLGAVLDADRNSNHDDGYHFYDSVREVRVVSSGLIFMTIELPDGTVLQVKLAGIENIADDMQWLLYAIRGDAFEGLPAGSLDMTEEEKIYRAYNT